MNRNFINLKKYQKKIIFGFFTSNGGVSKGDYFSLNCSKSNKDNINNVRKNIDIAVENLGIENKKLKLINQIHSNKVYLITKKNLKKKFIGDGIFTKEKDIALGILTADCAPIFIFNYRENIIGCLHSGWKGALNNIVEKSLKKMKIKGIETTDIVAVIGPCLSSKNFEVDKNFKTKFIKRSKSYKTFFSSKNRNKDLFDLRGLINFQLQKAGVKKIHNIRKDTYSNHGSFFSHRRATHQKKINSGRMINIIALKD